MSNQPMLVEKQRKAKHMLSSSGPFVLSITNISQAAYDSFILDDKRVHVIL